MCFGDDELHVCEKVKRAHSHSRANEERKDESWNGEWLVVVGLDGGRYIPMT